MRVALTFDAEHPSRSQCPSGAAGELVASLASAGVRATFFIQGRWATAYPLLARSVAATGHLIGSHSHFHAPLPNLTDRGLSDDLEKAETAVWHITGVDPRPWFRCPFGDGANDPRVVGALAERGYRHVPWSVAASDWEDERTAQSVEDDTVDQTLAFGDGAIVLLHTWPAPTVAALPGILKRLRLAGAQFVTVGELFGSRNRG